MSIGNKEIKATEGVLTFLNDNPVILDVGSNKGQWTDIILERFGNNCEIHLFEPNKILLDFTKIKYEYRENIIFNDLVAYKANTRIDFHYFENFNNELSSIYKGEDWKDLPMQTRKVQTRTIDTYCEELLMQYIDFVKIDCEGGDVDVLEGCLNLLKSGKIGVIQIEYGGHYPRANRKFDEVLAIAESVGYDVYYFDGGNYVKVKRSEFVEDFRAEDFFITKWNLPDYSIGWNKEFKINTAGMELDFVLEVGAFEGNTTKYICDVLLRKGGRVIVVDPLENYYTKEDTEHVEMFKDQYQRFLRNTYGLPVELIRKPSEVALPELHEFRFDMIYIDGHHGENEVYNDGINSFAICKDGGVILFDDYGWREETAKGIDRFLETYKYSVEIIEKGYQVMVKKIRGY